MLIIKVMFLPLLAALQGMVSVIVVAALAWWLWDPIQASAATTMTDTL